MAHVLKKSQPNGGTTDTIKPTRRCGLSGIGPLGQLIEVSHINQCLSHQCLSLPPSLKIKFFLKKEKYPEVNTLRVR